MSHLSAQACSLGKGNKAALVLLPFLSVIPPHTQASAQVIPSTETLGTVIDVFGDRLDISGGQRSEDRTNLFQNFEQFDLTAEQTANFVTTPEIRNVIGTVQGNSASTINGTLQVSGSHADLYLMNPAGMLLGPDTQLNLSGGFTATTATGLEFKNGQLSATQNSNYRNLTGDPTGFRFETQQPGAIVNLGELAVASGKTLNLIGGTLVNAGNLIAPDGTVTMAAVEGESLIRISQDNQLLSLEVEANRFDGTAPSSYVPTQNLGEMLTGSGLIGVNQININSDGSIRLDNTTRSNRAEGNSADGNQPLASMVPQQGGVAIASGYLSTAGNIGGTINVLGEHVSLLDAQLNADGATGGGLIRVGGDYRGQDTVITASETIINEASTLSANALVAGDGGHIIVWADDTTNFYGSLSATSGTLGGQGGFAEVSGKQILRFQGEADLRGSQGNFGTLLLDPENIEITDGPLRDPSASQMTSNAVENLFNTTNLIIEATNDIRIHDITDSALTVQTGRSIEFTANSDGVGGGQFVADNIALNAEQGNVTISGDGITLGDINTSTTDTAADGGNVLLNSSQGISLGAINTSSTVVSAEAGMGGTVALTAEAGSITVGNINTQSETTKNNTQQGGEVSLTASNDIITGVISTYAAAAQNNSQQGGQVSLTSGRDITTQDIFAYSSAGNNNSQRGGEVSLVAGRNITTQDISTFSSVGNNNAEDGGRVSLLANEGITTQAIQTQSVASRINKSANGGSVELTARNGPIEIALIDASGGTASAATETTVTIAGQGTFQATGAIAGNSISTVNSNNGSINITYSTDPEVPFVVGSASENGTIGGIVTSTDNLPFGSYLSNPPEASIELINGVPSPEVEPEPPIEPEPEVEPPVEPEPPIEPEPELPIEPEPEVEPTIDLELKVELPSALVPEIESPTEAAIEIEPPDEQAVTESTANSQGNLPASSPNIATSESASEERINARSPRIFSLNELKEENASQILSLVQPAITATDSNISLQILEQTEANIGEGFRQYLGIEGESIPVNIETIQDTLVDIEQTTGEQAALVYLYFVPNEASNDTHGILNSNLSSRERPAANADDELEIMLITKHQTVVRQRQQGVTREQVETVSKKLKEQSINQFSSSSQYLPPAQQLYNWMMAPIRNRLEQESISSLGFVMDTGLRTLPVAALHDGDRFLVENYSIGLLPSFSLTDFSNSNRRDFSTEQVLAMGASKFENQPALPAVEAEINFIAEQQPTNDIFLNEDFRLETIQTQLNQKDYDVLHLATHAAFESGNIENSYIQLWNEKLSLTDIDALNLSESDIDLIILSACNTALGDPASEYGFAGFTISTGLPTALASLWAVSDEGTLGFISQFYTQLRGASTRTSALQQAQISMIRGDVGMHDGVVYGPNDSVIAHLPSLEESGRWDFAHPFYWSTFTMIGNPW